MPFRWLKREGVGSFLLCQKGLCGYIGGIHLLRNSEAIESLDAVIGGISEPRPTSMDAFAGLPDAPWKTRSDRWRASASPTVL